MLAMPVSYDKQFLYIHIPKCAGSSITKALKASMRLRFEGKISHQIRMAHKIDTNFWHHLTAQSLQKFISAKQWGSYFKFAFVRNPWDRLVSFYFFHKKRTVESLKFREQNQEVTRIFDQAHTFEEWLLLESYVRPQTAYLSDSKGNLMIDYVGKYETIEDDFAFICKHLKVDAALPHHNRSQHDSYRTYYTEATKAFVERKFYQDIKAFHYSF